MKGPTIVAMGLLVSGMPAAACEVSYASSFQNNGATWMRVPKGGACDYAIARNTRNSLIDGIKISRPPRHGRAGVSGSSGVAYQAPTNFTGSDDFEIVILNGDAGSARFKTFKVDVY